jgi:alpha-tubulin suppressor-like RCC1 family protein
MSLVETEIRRRADEFGRWTPSLLPAGVNKWVPFLLQREWQSEMQLSTVAAGRNRSFFVDANGALLTCGREEEGEVGLLGLREGTSQTPFTAAVPTPVPSMAGVRVRAVACHDHCNLALSEAGQVFARGHQLSQSPEENIAWSKRLPPVPTVMEELRNHRVCQIAAGEYHCAAVTEDGALITWLTRAAYLPNEPNPELGYGSYVHNIRMPCRVFALEGERVTSVGVGDGFTVAVTEAGAVYSFGIAGGCLGHGQDDDGEDVYLPKRIEALDGIHVATVPRGKFMRLL